MRAAAGGRAAVFKRIRTGGCRTPRALRDQLSYVNDKAVYVTSTLIAEPEGGASLSPAEKMEIIDAFTDRWRGTTKLGHSSHMLLSFPQGVETEVVRDVAVEWAERLFESGHYGDNVGLRAGGARRPRPQARARDPQQPRGATTAPGSRAGARG